jgi:hypothetical protein
MLIYGIINYGNFLENYKLLFLGILSPLLELIELVEGRNDNGTFGRIAGIIDGGDWNLFCF